MARPRCLMLANPVVIPAYAAPEVWAVALLAMWAEIKTEIALLRRHVPTAGIASHLLLLNIVTWLAFLIAVDRLDRHGISLGWSVTGLEACVVIAESLLMWIGLRAWARAQQSSALPMMRVAWVALVGNLVSIAVSLAPVALMWLVR